MKSFIFFSLLIMSSLASAKTMPGKATASLCKDQACRSLISGQALNQLRQDLATQAGQNAYALAEKACGKDGMLLSSDSKEEETSNGQSLTFISSLSYSCAKLKFVETSETEPLCLEDGCDSGKGSAFTDQLGQISNALIELGPTLTSGKCGMGIVTISDKAPVTTHKIVKKSELQVKIKVGYFCT